MDQIPPLPNPQKNRKILLLLAGLVLLLSATILYFYKHNFDLPKQQVKPQKIKETTLLETVSEDHPTLFYTDLEYDPKTKVVTQLAEGKTFGDPPKLSATSSASLKQLSYRIDLISEKNQLITGGWTSVSKEVALTTRNTYIFRITVPYNPKSLVQVSFPNNQLIWTGAIR